MVVLSVVDIVLLIAGLAFYLFVVGGQLKRIATNLEECAELVRTIVGHARGDRARPRARQPHRWRRGRRAAAALRHGRGHRHRRHADSPTQPVERRPGPPGLRAAPVPAARRRRLRRARKRQPRPRRLTTVSARDSRRTISRAPDDAVASPGAGADLHGLAGGVRRGGGGVADRRPDQ